VYGEYFFAPSFTQFDVYHRTIPVGESTVVVIPEFFWPDNVGTADNINWIAAMTDESITQIYGEMDSWMFGWGM